MLMREGLAILIPSLTSCFLTHAVPALLSSYCREALSYVMLQEVRDVYTRCATSCNVCATIMHANAKWLSRTLPLIRVYRLNQSHRNAATVVLSDSVIYRPCFSYRIPHVTTYFIHAPNRIPLLFRPSRYDFITKGWGSKFGTTKCRTTDISGIQNGEY